MNTYNKHLVLFLLNGVLCFTLSCKFSLSDPKDVQVSDFFFTKGEPTFFFNNQPFTTEKLEESFPAVLKGLKLSSLKVNRENYMVTAVYGDGDYKINITDALQNKFQNISTFSLEYTSISSNPSDKKQIATVRDGYKTIANIDKDSISISFVFKKRYLIDVTSYQHKTPYKVWRFLELSNFRNLSE